MLRKFIVLGSVLLIAGAATLGWVLAEKREEQQKAAGYRSRHDSETNKYIEQYNEWLELPPEERAQLPWGLDEYGKTKRRAQLQIEQQERLNADLGRLATGEVNVYPFADVLYGENWQKELAKYKRRKELSELVLSASILCVLTGGAILSVSLLLLTARLLIRGSSGVAKFAATCLRGQEKTKAEQPTQADTKAKAKMKAKAKTDRKAKAEARAKAKAKRKAKTKAEKLAKAEEKARAKAEAKEKIRTEAEAEAEEKMRVEGQRSKARLAAAKVKKDSRVLRDSGWQGLEANSADQAEKIGVLLSDEKSIELEESLKAATENVNVSLKLKDSLKAQTENLEKQMAEFKQMAQSVQQAAVEQSEPINGTLTELTQQVAAIREYAASQQSRVEKLQDGYDWNIIKTFCLRVIRCIDNLEGRISRLTEQDVKAAHLEEIRDELIFALESSGVEQFKPEINSDYRGQEKYAEAIKGKESCEDPKRKGKIAKVIRPGYQYSISEENVKVVRPAQVRLFG